MTRNGVHGIRNALHRTRNGTLGIKIGIHGIRNIIHLIRVGFPRMRNGSHRIRNIHVIRNTSMAENSCYLG